MLEEDKGRFPVRQCDWNSHPVVLFLFDMIKLKECERGSRHQLSFSGE
jgi:hypothetical protein